jgi:CRISPR type I-E-associated protein CasB/Cse2
MSEAIDIGKAAYGWWARSLGDDGAGRMARAKLRRCETAEDALAIDATHALHLALGGRLQSRADTLALIAVALANIRDPHPQSAAARMGESLSALRFQALIRSDTAGLIRPLRRALVQIDSTANVGRLARDLFYWSDKTRNDWCFAYYGAAAPTPQTPDILPLSASEAEE